MTTDLKDDPLAKLFPRHRRTKISDDEMDRVHEAVKMLQEIDITSCDPIELEMLFMHIAYVVDAKNVFENNSNIESPRVDVYMSHIEFMMEASADAWCRRLYEYGFWRFSNALIVNIIWNWIRGTLDAPDDLVTM